MSNTSIKSIIITEKIIINVVDFNHCLNVGHCIVLTSWNIFFIPERIFLFFFISAIISKNTSGVKQAHSDLNRERRFWRPLFYQLNYGPLNYFLSLLSLCIVCFWQNGQNFFISKASLMFLGFLVVFVVTLLHSEHFNPIIRFSALLAIVFFINLMI